MKVKEIRELSIDELQQKEKSLVEELFKLRFRLSSGQLESPASVKTVQKDVARIKTVLKEKGVTR
ncbi:MAG: 50S ribosomal protein L29 [Syntrophales bacterium]|jgi:large subunit ribosomal protein L29|nr:50S ribosomal protein L29 [Syntrophales bacterium]MDY0043173.1 50S ribosomal protein L29 [Syntrophales bacterium]